MAQEDYTVTDQDGASHLAELNAIMAAIASNNSGATAPSVTYAHMWWVDTTSGWVKQRNAANSAWEKKFPIDKARVDVASAATLDLDANAVTSDYLRITGTTTVTAVTLAAGQRRIAVAGGAFQLTNSASLIVQGGADYTTTAGDLLMFLGESGGVVRVAIMKADGKAVRGSGGDQIFPIATPTLNAGAMTVQLNPCTITFRATSLTAGGVNTVELASGLSLTIPSGATLGAPNAVAQRLALLVAYNGGSPVLCVSNLTGGVNLDGTGLISPTTISASATSASVIYSASAVSANSPYQVVGFLDSTQATAGTYATAPTVIGGGAQQLGAMMTLGYGQTWQSVTRFANTTYYNTTGRAIAGNYLLSMDTSGARPIIIVNGVQIPGSNAYGAAVGVSIQAVIPPGASYTWSASVGSATMISAEELR